LKKEKGILASTEIKKKLLEDHKKDIPQSHIHYYIKNLGDLVDKVPLEKKVRYCAIGYRASKKAFAEDKKDYLLDQLVKLMIKAKVDSEKYGVKIKESDIQENIDRLLAGDKIG